MADLRTVSARIGADPLQVQGPGGNSSWKQGRLMAIKASGTWLAEAQTRNIMVTVDLPRIRKALAAGQSLDDTSPFIAAEDQSGGLRPSIETTVHAVFDHQAVLHTHCVETIALAIRRDAERLVADRLANLGAVFVPYVKPGADLARAILGLVRADTRVLVLGNHGLVAGADTPGEAEALLAATARALAGRSLPGLEVDAGFAGELSGTGWLPVPHAPTQAIAHDPARLRLAAMGTLYPDHLIFLGPGVVVAEPGESIAGTLARARNMAPQRRLVIVPGRGVALTEDASPAMQAMANALGDVLARVPPDTEIVAIPRAEEAALLNWDAEKYRQALEAARGGG